MTYFSHKLTTHDLGERLWLTLSPDLQFYTPWTIGDLIQGCQSWTRIGSYLSPNRTYLGLFRNSFKLILARWAKMHWTFIFKSHRLVPFRTHLTQYVSTSDIPGVLSGQWQTCRLPQGWQFGRKLGHIDTEWVTYRTHRLLCFSSSREVNILL